MLLYHYIFNVDGEDIHFYDASLAGAKRQFEDLVGRPPLKSDFVKRAND